METETYHGVCWNIKYLLRVTIEVSWRSLVYTQEWGVVNYKPASNWSDHQDSIQIDLNCEDCFEVSYDVDRCKFGWKDVVYGWITVNKMVSGFEGMDIEIVKKENNKWNDATQVERTVIAKYEVMEGMPREHDIIPFNLYLEPYELTQTFKNVNQQFSVEYYLNLVIKGSDNKVLSKEKEIFMYRIRKEKKEKGVPENILNQGRECIKSDTAP